MKDKIKKLLNIIVFGISIILAFGINIYFLPENDSLGLSIFSNDILFLIYFVGIFIILKNALKIENKRMWIMSSILSIIFSVCFIAGEIGNKYYNTVIPNSANFILYIIIKVITSFVLFSNILIIIFNNMGKIFNKLVINNKEYKLFTANKKSIFFVAGIFLISYIPYFLYYYPGTIQYDAIASLEQINGYTQYSNHHPILFTLFFGGLWNFGKNVLGNGNYGLAIYTVIQMTATSLVLSILIYYMAKRNIPTKWRIITFLILLFNPLTAMYTVRVEKSMFFTLTMILVVIGIAEIITKKEEFFKKKSKVIIFSILLLLLALLRNNGIYVIILTLIVILTVCKNIRIKILTIFMIPTVIFFIIQGPILNALNIEKARTKEALSIPIQQFARLIKYENQNLTEEEKANIHKYLPVEDEKIASEYQSLISDNIKFDFSEEAIKEDKVTLLKTYFKLALKYPRQTVSAFLFNTYGYYAPNSYNIWGAPNFNFETSTVIQSIGTVDLNDNVSKEIYEMPVENKYDIHPNPIINLSYIDRINNHILMKDIPVFSMLITSIGLYFWLLLTCIVYCIYKKQYKKIIIMLPILFLWLTSVAGLVVELRYVYSMLLLMPLYIGITFMIDNVEKKEEEV